jgi:hypothetical protein
MIGFKIIQKVDGKCTDVYISVAQTQSLFDCLVDQVGHPVNWTKLLVHVNGMHALGWRKQCHSGFFYPARGFKDTLDQHFQKLCTRQDHPTLEIYLSQCHPVATDKAMDHVAKEHAEGMGAK